MSSTRGEQEIRLLLAPKRPLRRALPWLIAAAATFLTILTYSTGYVPVAAERDQKTAEVEALSGVRRQANSLTQSLAASRAEAVRLTHELAPARARETEDRQLLARLQQSLQGSGVEVARTDGLVTLSISERLLYKGTDLGFTPAGQELLGKVGAVLATVKGRTVEVGAHTDNLPVTRKLRLRFPTVWEFSTSRATQIVRFLSEQSDAAVEAGQTGIDAQKLVAAGYGSQRPVASNKTAKGRLKNRRIEIKLIPPPLGSPATPAAAAAPAKPPAPQAKNN